MTKDNRIAAFNRLGVKTGDTITCLSVGEKLDYSRPYCNKYLRAWLDIGLIEVVGREARPGSGGNTFVIYKALTDSQHYIQQEPFTPKKVLPKKDEEEDTTPVDMNDLRARCEAAFIKYFCQPPKPESDGQANISTLFS